MDAILNSHSDSRPKAKPKIQVELSRSAPDLLDLHWIMTGDLSALRIPPPAPPVRRDGLWQHTCFEAFVAGGGEGYDEFNFAPSGEWAAWRFAGYRSGMAELDSPPPRIETALAPNRIELRASISVPAARFRLGLSAVVEEADGAKSYWAVAHPPGAPDFHDPACFALQVPPPPGP